MVDGLSPTWYDRFSLFLKPISSCRSHARIPLSKSYCWMRFQSWVITAAVGEIKLWEILTFCCVFELQCFRLLLPKFRWCQKSHAYNYVGLKDLLSLIYWCRPAVLISTYIRYRYNLIPDCDRFCLSHLPSFHSS